MSRRILLLAAALVAGAMAAGAAPAQTAQPSTAAAPEPKLPPMPSMEGQQGDLGKPLTAVPRKAATPQRHAPDARRAVRPATKPRKTMR